MSARSPSSLCLAACLLVGTPLGAQLSAPPAAPPAAAAEPAALKALRQDLLAKVLADSRQLSTQYAAALAKLEDSLAASGDYEDAISARDTRRALETVYPASTEAPQTIPGTITLPLEQARLSGAAALEIGAITGWRTAKSAAEWSLTRLATGKYTVEVAYAMVELPLSPGTTSSSSRFATADEAEFRLVDASILASSTNVAEVTLRNGNVLPGQEIATGGTISVTRQSISLRLEPKEGYPANAITIKAVRLVPVVPDAAAPSAPAPVSAGSESGIATLRQSFLQRLATVREPIITAYTAKLDSLAKLPADTEWTADVKGEHRRANRMREVMKRSGEWRLDAQGAGGLDGFEDLADARYVDDPSNTADHFIVEHDGQRFPVRLAWVRCPPPTDAEKGGVQKAASFFGLAPEDLLAVGRLAAEFTRGHLEGRPLRLLVRSGAAAGEAAPALVFVNESSLLQGALIDLGLAMLAPPTAGGKRSVTESALIKSLADREKHVREAASPTGIWGLRDPSKTPPVR